MSTTPLRHALPECKLQSYAEIYIFQIEANVKPILRSSSTIFISYGGLVQPWRRTGGGSYTRETGVSWLTQSHELHQITTFGHRLRIQIVSPRGVNPRNYCYGSQTPRQ